MKPGITNAYAVTSEDSSVVIESTFPLNHILKREGPDTFMITADGGLIMAPDTISVYDGLVNTVSIKDKDNGAQAVIDLQYPSSCRVKKVPGLPNKLILSFDRYYVNKMLEGKLIVLDPGHGGKDRGKRGYINLWEKNITYEIAEFLKRDLRFYGAKPVLTREKDVICSDEERAKIPHAIGADMFLSIHTHWSEDISVKGCFCHYAGKRGKQLGDALLGELNKKVRLDILGIAEKPKIEGYDMQNIGIPMVWIEVCAISNPVEEGWLRSPVFKARVARSLMNGIVRYIFSEMKRT